MDNEETQDYRLNKMESQLELLAQKVDKLLELFTEFKIQKKDIENIFNRQDELQDDIKAMKEEIQNLKNAPVRRSAEKWNYIIEYAFKSFIALVFAAVLVKVGLK